MKFFSPTHQGFLLQRYKRFLADIQWSDGKISTVHVPNTGPMTGCLFPKGKVLCSSPRSQGTSSPKRKYPLTLEMTSNDQTWIGVNTHNANKIVAEALEEKLCDELIEYDQWTQEVSISSRDPIPGHEKSRLDFLLTNTKTNHQAYMEVKSVTLAEKEHHHRVAYFPDTVSLRARKHLHLLMTLKQQPKTDCILFFLIQREDIDVFKPAAHIDPIYAQQLEDAFQKGLKVLAYKCTLHPDGINLKEKVPCQWS
jgi:sugar fermentation stimulation protein A